MQDTQWDGDIMETSRKDASWDKCRVMKALPASDSRRMDMGGWAWEERTCPKQGSTSEGGHEKLEQ